MTKILFLGGPSGSGKSFFASNHLTSMDWIHLQIDQHPLDGINQHHLRAEWDAFYFSFNPEPLREELIRRGASASGIVLSFPSNLIFSTQHIHAAVGHFQIVYLYGHPAHCLHSFLQREQLTERNLSASHWNCNNHSVFEKLSYSIQHPFLINAFNEDGTRRHPQKIYDDVFRNNPVP